MKRTKLILVLLLALIAMATAVFAVSCGDDPIDDEKELVAVEVENVPEEAIIIGKFDDANVTVKLTYDDESVERIPFTEGMIPEKDRHYLTEEGTHDITVMYRGFRLSFSITMRNLYVYEVTFLNALDEVVKVQEVTEGNGATAPSDEEMAVEGYRFLGTFDKDFSLVTEDMTIKGEYVKTWKVTYYNAYGEIIKAYVVDDGESSPEPTEEERAVEGYDFYGWDRSVEEIHKNTKVYGIYYEITGHQHIFEEISREAATCGSDGQVTYKCKDCDESYTVTLPALGHAWGEWTVVTQASCESSGQERRVCGHDEDHIEVRAISPLGHNYVGGVCTRCGAQENISGATYTREGDYIYFGSYPQTDVTVSQGEELSAQYATALPENGNNNGWSSYGYYIN
ncbi:MAG: hypothetical protein J5836_02485, partial [Clostridia bacterium]|nr:hypothetical protein [Clostridia bacterium]